MECVRRGSRHPGLPTLSLGCTSVRLIVRQLEEQYNDRQIVKYDPTNDCQDYDTPFDPSRGSVFQKIFCIVGAIITECIPSVTITNFGVIAVLAGIFAPNMFSYIVVYPFCRLVFGTLYPAYASYKAVRTKNLKEYVKWMMYWIVFALFTCTETFTDVFLSWFPFYYEVKIVLVLWLLSPATKGSSILYRKFVHPALCRREQEIDEYIAKAKDQGYHTVLNLGTKGVNYATTVIMQTAIKGGGGLVQQIKRSYSLSDLSECDPRDERSIDEADDVLAEPQLIRRNVARSGYNTRRSASESNRSSLYFPEVDVEVRSNRSSRSDEPDFSHIKSSEDISSGYSSADNSGTSLSRTGSIGPGARAKARQRTTVTSIKRPVAAEDSEVIIEEIQDDDFDYANMPPLMSDPSQIFLSHSRPPFLYRYVGDQVQIIQMLDDKILVEPNVRDQTSTVDELARKTVTEYEVESQPENVDVSQTIADESKPTEKSFLDLNDKKIKVEAATHETTVFENSILTPNNKDNECEIDLNSKLEIPIPAETPTAVENPISTEVETPISVEIEKPISTDVEKPILTFVENNDACSITLETDNLKAICTDNDSMNSDDEASFGTPDDSPKAKRKSPKGRYGKGKAPAPPTQSNTDQPIGDNTSVESLSVQSDLSNLLESLPNAHFKESTTQPNKNLQVNPIAENKKRHKSKSPGRIPKVNSATISKLLNLPGKLVFWNKSDTKSKGDNSSVSSNDESRRSSYVENIDDYQSCADLNMAVADDNDTIIRLKDDDIIEIPLSDDQISFKDADDFENEALNQNIIDKSDALQKLIEAKIESHPEYKFTATEPENPGTSKSTDV